MEQLLYNYKTCLKNVYYIFYSLDNTFNYQRYKQIAFSNQRAVTITEIKAKDYFDAFLVALNNKEALIDSKFLRKIMNLYLGNP